MQHYLDQRQEKLNRKIPLSQTTHLAIVSPITWNVLIKNKYNEIAFFKVVGYNSSLLKIICIIVEDMIFLSIIIIYKTWLFSAL